MLLMGGKECTQEGVLGLFIFASSTSAPEEGTNFYVLNQFCARNLRSKARKSNAAHSRSRYASFFSRFFSRQLDTWCPSAAKQCNITAIVVYRPRGIDRRSISALPCRETSSSSF